MSAGPGEFLFEGLDQHRGPAPLAGVFASGIVHLLVLSLAWGVAGELREAERREARDRAAVEETARSADRRLIWYPEPKRVPEVSPSKPFGPGKTPQGQLSRETLIAQSDNPESKRQFVYRPSRPERLKADVEAANLVAAPEELARQTAPELPPAQKTQRPRRGFEGLPAPAKKAPAVEVAVAEEILRAAEGVRDAAAEAKGAAGLKVGRVAKPLRQFDARSLEGARPRGVQAGEVTVSDDLLRAAEVVRDSGAEARGAAGLQAGRVAKPAPRRFEGVPQGRGSGGGVGGGGNGAQMVSAPEIGGETVAVISLNPGPKTVLPEGSRPGQFARAPVEGEPSSGSGGGGVRVPGLMAKGLPAGASGSANPTAEAAPAAAVPDRKKMQELAVPPVARTISAPLRAGARVVPPLVESVFSGRNVYTLVVPDVKMPGYRGDWIIWFGGRELTEGRMAAPYPSAKMLVDGSNGGAAGGVREAFVQFGAVIGSDGRLSKVRVLRTRADEAFKTRALLELQTWAFRPATINGQSVEVDAVIEVTFVF